MAPTVEKWNGKFYAAANRTPLFASDSPLGPWEIGGNNEDWKKGFIEGSWMIKLNGRYYLTYSCSGTEYYNYAMGAYISDSPLGTSPMALLPSVPAFFPPTLADRTRKSSPTGPSTPAPAAKCPSITPASSTSPARATRRGLSR